MERSKNIKKKRVRHREEGNREAGERRLKMAQSVGEYGLYFSALIGLACAILVVPLSALPPSSHPHRKSPVVKMDEAILTVSNELQSDMVVSWLSDHCYQCLFQPLGIVPAGSQPGSPSVADFTVGTQHPLTLQLNSSPVNLEQCRLHFHFGEQGKYSLWVKNLNDPSEVNCTLVTETEPVNSYLSILFAFLGFIGLAVLAAIGNTIMGLEVVKNHLLRWGNAMETDRLINSELGPSSHLVDSSAEAIPATAGRRLRSLDTFRGFSLVVMVFVNYGGGRYWFFRHESWNGLTVADLVFPWFVFIMGTSVGLSTSGSLRRGGTRSSLLVKVLWRSIQLFLIGLIIINPNYCQGPLSWNSLRIPGVLQRLAFSYLVVASLDLLVARVRFDNLPVSAWWYPVSDVLLYWPAWLSVIFLEAMWLYLTFLLPVPGCPSGYLGPGGLGDFGQYPNCTGGAAGFIDRWLLGDSHIYQTPSSRVVYKSTVPYDPEGVLGSLNSILMAFLGLQAGKILLHYSELHSKIIFRFLLWGFILGVISAVLTKCSKDHGFIPINKNLWSLSYVTTLSCFAFVILAAVYYIVDERRWWSGAPFFYPGDYDCYSKLIIICMLLTKDTQTKA